MGVEGGVEGGGVKEVGREVGGGGVMGMEEEMGGAIEVVEVVLRVSHKFYQRRRLKNKKKKKKKKKKRKRTQHL